jgi:hypothetical protein
MAMTGERAVRQEALFYGFSLEEHVPADHLLCSIDCFVELTDVGDSLSRTTARSGAQAGA